MAGNVKGDFGALAKLAETLKNLDKEIVPDVALKAAVAINEVVEEQFDQGKDPYGRSWEPLADSTIKKGRTPPPLTASGKMRRKAKAVPGVKGIVEKIPSPAGFHQTGTKKMPARMLVPHGVLPPLWSDALKAVGAEVLKTKLKIGGRKK